MIDWLIKKLGGFTLERYMECYTAFSKAQDTIDDQRRTIAELQTLIPVSAVTPKRKRGRPRKNPN